MFLQVTNELLKGFGLTVLLFAVTLVAAIPLGLFIAFCSMTRFTPLKLLTKAFVWVIRGTPLMLQIIVISFIPSYLFDVLNREIADFFGTTMANVNFIFVCIAFVINYAAYFSEIFRGGIESIPKGQNEAALVLGMIWLLYGGKTVGDSAITPEFMSAMISINFVIEAITFTLLTPPIVYAINAQEGKHAAGN